MSFDYVVVGAGAAGCVLAARLTQDPDTRVLLLEAGDHASDDAARVPALGGTQFKTMRDWDFDTEPEPGRDGRRTYLPRGRVVGGSTVLNTSIYIRGNPLDYDEWAALTGDQRWSWASVLPYFLRSEDYEGGPSEYHAVGGPLRVSRRRTDHGLPDFWVDAAIEYGLARNEDFNGTRQDGVGFYELNHRDGVRESAATAFLRPALARPNLTVATNALVHKVVITGGRARGVRYEHAGEEVMVEAEREVLLCAGAYQSPHLLLLSGIGPADELRAFGIQPLIDLPVGRGLTDHYAVPMVWLSRRATLASLLTPEAMSRWQERGTGPFASNIAEAGAFLRTRAELSAPDVQLHMAQVAYLDDGLGAATVDAWTAAPLALRPTSRGMVMLRTPDPQAAPRIQHNYLSTDEDCAVVVAGLRATLQIARHQPIAQETAGGIRIPDDDATDMALLAFARRYGASLYHPTSTCAIGPVVNAEFQVHGLQGLRVVDASVMPSIPRGNTSAPTTMIAERAADLIMHSSTTLST